MQTLNELLNFLKNPYKASEYRNIKGKEFLFLLLIIIMVVIPFPLLIELAELDQLDHKLIEMLEKNRWLVAIGAIVLAPMIEEPVFRLHLDLKKASIWWGLALSIFLIGDFWYPIVLFWGYLIFLQVRVSQGNPPSMKFIVYCSATFFAIVHMANFKELDYSEFIFWIPLLVGSQFFEGLILSYIRLNFGIKWSILFHGAFNAIFILPAVYFFNP